MTKTTRRQEDADSIINKARNVIDHWHQLVHATKHGSSQDAFEKKHTLVLELDALEILINSYQVRYIDLFDK